MLSRMNNSKILLTHVLYRSLRINVKSLKSFGKDVLFDQELHIAYNFITDSDIRVFLPYWHQWSTDERTHSFHAPALAFQDDVASALHKLFSIVDKYATRVRNDNNRWRFIELKLNVCMFLDRLFVKLQFRSPQLYHWCGQLFLRLCCPKQRINILR